MRVTLDRAGRRRRLGRGAHAVPRRRRPVADLRRRRTSRSSTARPTSLAQWAQAGGGRFELLDDGSGGITPIDGLGMIWYPVKPYADFRLKFQFREGADGRRALQRRRVRPLPGSARRRSTERPDACARTGTAANDEAWVAIYCGHEIQLYDGTGDEQQKTGSIYNFDNNDLDEIGEPSRGRRVERLRDRGRRPDVPDLPQRRADQRVREHAGHRARPAPATRRRSSASSRRASSACRTTAAPDRDAVPRHPRRGPRRRTRPGADPTRAVHVTGSGPHTVEVRSVDAAGNVEAKQAVDFEIGEAAAARRDPPRATSADRSRRARTRRRRSGSAASTSRVGARSASPSGGLTVPVACTGAMSGTATLTVSASDARASSGSAADAREPDRALLRRAHGDGDAQAVQGARCAS